MLAHHLGLYSAAGNTDYRNNLHYFLCSGLGKKMDAISKGRGLQDVGLWGKSVVNHLYWSASTSTSGEEVVDKWRSVANHIQNIHSHENTLFPASLHEPLVGEQPRHWLKPSNYRCSFVHL